MDSLSNLHQSLIDHILERLPQKDRVRTSILSSKWRFLWCHLPSLLLDSEFYSSVCTDKNRPLSDYLYIVTSILLQRDCYSPRVLSLFIPPNSGTYGVGIFDHLIKNSICDDNFQRLSVENNETNPYRLPPTVFSSVTSSSLTHLRLRKCEFSPPPSFQGFCSLLEFELYNCQVTSDIISRFVASCPTLCKLVLLNVNFTGQSLDIDAPELRHLCVHGTFDWLFLINVESIEVVDIATEALPEPWEGMRAIIPNLFNGMTKLKNITFGGRFCELLARHSGSLKLATNDGLTSLVFADLHTVDMLVYVWNSIKLFPNLKEVTISMANGAAGEAGLNDQDNDYDLPSLFRVDFTNISGKKLEMKLIECLLSWTPALNMMSIEFNSGISHEQMLKYVREITMFRRASNMAKVHISECVYCPPPRYCRHCHKLPL